MSVGDEKRGPLTVGEINAFGLSFALYQTWMYMAVFAAAKTFRPSDAFPFFPGFPVELQPFLTFSFLIASTVCLLCIAVAGKRLDGFMPRRRAVLVATLGCFAGTLLVFLGSPLGIAGAVVGGTLMGVGSSVFLIRWGSAFSSFDFATSVINSAIAFALGFVVAVGLVNWVPSPFAGLLAVLMPVLMAMAFWNRKPTTTTASYDSVKNKYISGYLVRFAVCLVFFGFVMGALRSICGTQLLSFNDAAVELVLGVGCFISVVVLLGAMIATKRETSWDSMFRIISPVVVLGIVGLTLLSGDLIILGCFFASIGYVCLEALLWIFLANMAKSLSGSSVFVFGLGYGILQAFSIAGTAVEGALVRNADALAPEAFGYEMSNMALMLIAVLAFGYAILPRYRELKAVLASMIKDEMPALKDELSVDNEWSISSEAPAAPESEAATIDESELKVAEYTPSSPHEKGSFMRRCDEIVATYLLSEREREVLVFLAKGHNAAFIQDKLCISRSTAKTHINHIYKKLDIHTQQELLNMVEDRKRGPVAEPVARATYSHNGF